ncbi:protein translocase subunit SecD [bacterium]|nr:MAG: protein translocase subunit SecD [bacterium]QQR61976.1 MAG: protein translocase subunit SecD [bacterium]QQR62431.1 MAG: protein translocase subunit SecD [bacterium]
MQQYARKVLFSELTLWLFMALICVYWLYPIRNALRFGSDLVGGVYLTLQVQVDKAVEAACSSVMNSMYMNLKTQGIHVSAKEIKDGKVIFTFASMNEAQKAAQTFKTQNIEMKVDAVGLTVILSFSPQKLERIKYDAVQRNIEVLRLRLDKFGVSETPIAPQGDKNIVIELPDVSDPQAAKELIGKAALLEFRLVDKVASSKDDLLYEVEGTVAHDKEILPGIMEGGRRSFYLVEKYAQVTGRMLKDARPSLGGRSGVEAVVEFTLDTEGGEKFYTLTNANFGKQLAIVLDGEVISAPVIHTAIKDKGSITGNFNTESAKSLALLLKSGAFVAPVTFEEERQIGPSLGQEARTAGLMSCMVGFLLILLFSFFFYKLSGFFAFLVLVYNILLVLVGMSLLGATLTLPGIAGIVLTIGMAIDASILIFETIKEELSHGTSVEKAVHVGFSDAMVVILDGNLTTFIVGVVLYYLGSGPVQGFATTLMLGIVSTLITGLFFLKSLFKMMLRNFNVQKLSI